MEKLKSAFNWVVNHVILVLSIIISIMYMILQWKNGQIKNLKVDKSLADTKSDAAVAAEKVAELDKDISKEEALQQALKKAQEKPTEGADYYKDRYKK